MSLIASQQARFVRQFVHQWLATQPLQAPHLNIRRGATAITVGLHSRLAFALACVYSHLTYKPDIVLNLCMASRIDTLISKCRSWDEFVELVNALPKTKNKEDDRSKSLIPAGVYNRAEYRSQKQAVLQQWSDIVEGAVS